MFVREWKLAMNKCKYYWLKPKRIKYKYEFEEGQDKEMDFKVGRLNKEVKLRYLSPKEEHEILVIWILPSGKRKQQVRTIVEKLKEWAERMNKSGLPAYLKEQSYKIHMWPRVRYPIGFSLISETKAERTMAPALRVLRGAMFLSRAFSGEPIKLPEK